MNGAPAALAALVAPSLAPGGAAPAGAGAPSPLDEGAGEAGLGFAGLLGPEADPASLGGEGPAATTDIAVDPVPAAAPSTPPTAATPPPMTDPATTAVLNALALRVATESNTPAGSLATGADPRALPATAAAGQGVAVGLGLALQALGSAIAQVTGRGAAGMTPGNPGTTAAASGAAVPLPQGIVADAVMGDVPLEGLLADPAPARPGGDPATASSAATTALPGFLGSSAAQPAALGSLAAPLAAIANAVAALAPASTAADGNELPMLSGVQGGAGIDASALAAATLNASLPAQPAAASPQQPAAFHAFLRADGSLPQIAVPMDSPQWGNELSTRVVAMAREQFTEAEIRVTPDELGPIEVKLRFDGDRVHAQFGAISPEAREALTANLQRLREMLAGEGLNLGQAFVGHHGADRQPGQSSAGAKGGFGNDAAGDELAAMPLAPRASSARVGLLDEFA